MFISKKMPNNPLTLQAQSYSLSWSSSSIEIYRVTPFFGHLVLWTNKIKISCDLGALLGCHGVSKLTKDRLMRLVVTKRGRPGQQRVKGH